MYSCKTLNGYTGSDCWQTKSGFFRLALARMIGSGRLHLRQPDQALRMGPLEMGDHESYLYHNQSCGWGSVFYGINFSAIGDSAEINHNTSSPLCSSTR